MKKTAIFFVILFNTILLSAQNVPNNIFYKSFAFTSKGEIVKNKKIIVEISILRDNSTGTLVYKEIHNPQTNLIGEYILQIGEGTPVFEGETTNFNSIDWDLYKYFIKVRTDTGQDAVVNGLNFTELYEFGSVPYANYSAKSFVADSLSSPVRINFSQLKDVNISSPADKQFVAWDASTQKWITADPTGDPGVFVRTDGTKDLTGDWTISSNNIILTSGNLKSNSFSTNSGVTISDFSDDILLADSSANSLITEKAVKTYVDNLLLNGAWIKNANYIYVTGIQNVGIGISNPTHKFEVNSAGSGVVFYGNFSGTVPDLGAGTRMSFYPSKASFRAGQINTKPDYWDNANVGNYSAAFGLDTKASGSSSFSAGNNNVAAGNSSVSFGKDNSSGSLYSFSSGSSNSVTGISSAAIGTNILAHGDYSFATGNSSRTGNVSGVGGDYSFAFGENSVVEGNYAFSGGYFNTAYANYSFVGGQNSQTSINGIAAFSFGNSTHAKSNYSVAFGLGSITNSMCETVLGKYNYSVGISYNSWISTEALFSLGNGADASNRSNAFVVLKNGNTGIGLGQNSPTYLLEVGKLDDGSSAIANHWLLYSDINLKKELVKIDKSSEKLKTLSGYYFYWKEGIDTSRHIGVIAQEVEKVFPEIVFTNKKGIKAVDYQYFVPAFIEAFKEQDNSISILKEENKILKAENEELKKLINDNLLRIENIEEYIKASSSANIIK